MLERNLWKSRGLSEEQRTLRPESVHEARLYIAKIHDKRKQEIAKATLFWLIYGGGQSSRLGYTGRDRRRFRTVRAMLEFILPVTRS